MQLAVIIIGIQLISAGVCQLPLELPILPDHPDLPRINLDDLTPVECEIPCDCLVGTNMFVVNCNNRELTQIPPPPIEAYRNHVESIGPGPPMTTTSSTFNPATPTTGPNPIITNSIEPMPWSSIPVPISTTPQPVLTTTGFPTTTEPPSPPPTTTPTTTTQTTTTTTRVVARRKREALAFTALILSDNMLTDDSFSSLIDWVDLRVDHIDLSNNLIEASVSLQELGELRDLKTLDLSVNRIVSITSNTIAFIPSVTHLSYNGNAIETIEHASFQESQGLQMLLLAGNRLSNVDVSVWSQLRGIQILDLNSNLLTSVRHYATGMPTLRYLDIGINSLQSISDFLDPAMMPNNALETLRLGNEELNIPPTAFINFLGLQNIEFTLLRQTELSVENNMLQSYGLFNMPNLQRFTYGQPQSVEILSYVDLPALINIVSPERGTTNFTVINCGSLRGFSLRSHIFSLRSLLLLDLQRIFISDINNPIGTFDTPGELRILVLKDVGLSGQFRSTRYFLAGNQVRSLVDLNLSENGITEIASLDNFPNIEAAFFSDNSLDSFDFSVLGSSTIHVDLSLNLISTLRVTSTTNLPNLKSIYLEFNQLTSVSDAVFTSFPSLEIINLSRNFITRLFPLSSQRPAGLITIVTEYNEWECTCGLLRDYQQAVDAQFVCDNETNNADPCIQCFTPLNLRGYYLGDLQCNSQGVISPLNATDIPPPSPPPPQGPNILTVIVPPVVGALVIIVVVIIIVCVCRRKARQKTVKQEDVYEDIKNYQLGPDLPERNNMPLSKLGTPALPNRNEFTKNKDPSPKPNNKNEYYLNPISISGTKTLDQNQYLVPTAPSSNNENEDGYLIATPNSRKSNISLNQTGVSKPGEPDYLEPMVKPSTNSNPNLPTSGSLYEAGYITVPEGQTLPPSVYESGYLAFPQGQTLPQSTPESIKKVADSPEYETAKGNTKEIYLNENEARDPYLNEDQGQLKDSLRKTYVNGPKSG